MRSFQTNAGLKTSRPSPGSSRFTRLLSPQDVYRSHRPKEKPPQDSNNNENSVPKDFDTIDSNSNLAARSKHAKHKLDKAKAQGMLGKSANEVLKYPAVHARGHAHNRTLGGKVPTVSAALQGSSQDPPSRQVGKMAVELPTSSELRKEQPRCEISGKEAISALSRAKSRECRQQIVQVYCQHKERALMPEKVPRYCPIDGESWAPPLALALALAVAEVKRFGSHSLVVKCRSQHRSWRRGAAP